MGWNGTINAKFVKDIENDKKYTHTKALTYIPPHTVEKKVMEMAFSV